MMMIEKKVIAKAKKKTFCTNVICTHTSDARFKDNEKLTDAFTALDQLTFRFKGPNSFIMFIQ